MISAETYNADYEKAVKFGYNKAIDEFAEKLKAELLDAKRVLSERREMQERESEMAKMCSYNIGVLNAVGSMVGEIAEQLKEE